MTRQRARARTTPVIRAVLAREPGVSIERFVFVDMVVVVVVVIGVWWWLWLVVIVMMWWVRLGMCV